MKTRTKRLLQERRLRPAAPRNPHHRGDAGLRELRASTFVSSRDVTTVGESGFEVLRRPRTGHPRSPKPVLSTGPHGRREITCGVSIGIQDTPEQLLQKIETELAAGYRRIKVKVKPGWDVNVLEKIRGRWADIVLSVDANSAYTLDQVEHIRKFDQFKLLMIEQPLWDDEIYLHARLQKAIETAICLDEAIHHARSADFALETGACRIINIKVGRVGGFTEAIKVHDVAQKHDAPVWCGGMLESGVGRAHNIALSTLAGFRLPGDVSASKRYWKQDIIEPEVEVRGDGTIAISDEAGTGYKVREELVKKFTVREETFRA